MSDWLINDPVDAAASSSLNSVFLSKQETFFFRLEDSGYSIGQRVTELIGIRERIVKRETRVVNMLQVVNII